MSVHLYAICEADGAVAPAGRPGRVRPELVVADDLAALVDEGSERSPSPSVEELWAHEETVEELMATCDLLPVRYGSDVDDRDAVQRLLRMRHDELAEGLRRVRGAVELAVRARVLTAPKRADFDDPAGDNAGTAYMAAALARDHRTRALTQRIGDGLRGIAREGRMLPTAEPMLGCAGGYLVDRRRVVTFRDRVQELDAELGDVHITCTGPWPPYSFAQAEPKGVG